MAVVILAERSYTQNQQVFEEDTSQLHGQYWIASCFGVITGTILASCAFYLTRVVKNLAQQKPNICLVVLHIANVFLQVTLIFIKDYFYQRWQESL